MAFLAIACTWQTLCQQLFPGKNATFHRRQTERILRDVYGDKGFREGMDLWVGGLAEAKLPGALVGPTFAWILGITFHRLQIGDRFWYENPYTFSSAQRQQIQQHALLSKVVCTNGDDIPQIQRSIFHTSPARVNCSSIPEINLLHWWDRKCFSNFYISSQYGYYKYWDRLALFTLTRALTHSCFSFHDNSHTYMIQTYL